MSAIAFGALVAQAMDLAGPETVLLEPEPEPARARTLGSEALQLPGESLERPSAPATAGVFVGQVPIAIPLLILSTIATLITGAGAMAMGVKASVCAIRIPGMPYSQRVG